MSSFSITTPDTEITLRPSAVKVGQSATGTTTYTVTNRSGQTIRTRLNLEAVTTDGTSAKWFAVKGDTEQDIGPALSGTFTVEVSFPGASAQTVPEEQRKKHSFRGIAVNLKDGDNDYERGSVVAFREPVLVVDKPFPWKWAVAAAALVVLAGGTYWAIKEFQEPDIVEIPKEDPPMVVLANWEKHTLQEARAALEAQKLVVEDQIQNPVAPDPSQVQFYLQVVQSQTPPVTADSPRQIKTGETVKLMWNWEVKKVDVPPLKDKSLSAAVDLLHGAGLEVGTIREPTGPRPNRFSYEAVDTWAPQGNVPAFTEVILTMVWKQRGNVVIRDHRTFAEAKSEATKRTKKPLRPTGVEIDGN